MKCRKMLTVGLFVAGLLGGSLFSSSEIVQADDYDKAYIPNNAIRQPAYGSLIEQGIIGENEIPTFNQLKQAQVEGIGISYSGENQIGGELFGAQFLKNATFIGGSFPHNVYDFRPIAGMDNLEEISLGMNPMDERESSVDITFMTNLKKLKRIYYFEYNVLDLSPLNNLDSLDLISIGNPHLNSFFKGTPQLVSKANKELVFVNPVTYSKQFDGATVEAVVVGSDKNTLDNEVLINGKIITIKDLDPANDSVKVVITKENEDGTIAHRLQYRIPLEWY